MATLGEFAEGEQLCEKGLSFAHKINHLFSIAMAEYKYGGLFTIKGDGKNAVKHLQSSIEYLEKSQGVTFLPLAWAYLGVGYHLLGELNTALKFIEKGLKMQMDTGILFGLSGDHYNLSLVHFDLGNLSEAKLHAEQALNLAQTNQEKLSEGISWIQLGRIIGKTEKLQIDKAEEYILKGMKISDELKTKPNYALGYLFLGELYANAGQKEKALENLKKAEAMFQEMGMNYYLARTKKLLETL
jgi:tetratricopeptide (TPR) repeat protein